jgi:bla regulator protein blaR1
MIDLDLSGLANHLWQSTLCVGAAWILTLALKNNRASLRYWVWLAASVKFLVPFGLLVSAGSQLGWRTAPAVPQRIIPVVISEISRPFLPSSSGPRLPADSPAPRNWPGILLFAVWTCGFSSAAGCWLRWRQRIRKARRAAIAVDLHLAVPVMSSRSRLEPGVFGIWKPVLLLPEGIQERLTLAQLQTVVEHELCHVRRRDNLTGAIHMVVEAVFWFHPLVWWLRSRLVEERERACDEDILGRVTDARDYAEAILTVCRFYLELPPANAAGVGGSNLRKRIEEIMAGRSLRELDPGRMLLLATAGLAAVVAPIVIGMIDGQPMRAQSQPSERLAFAVASIKENKSKDARDEAFEFLPGGRFVARNCPLFFLIANAYNLPFQSDRLTGGPDWIRETQYDIEAKTEDGAIAPGTSGKARDDKIRLMLQTLLAERFKMVMRREIKELPVYAVVVRKGGPKMQKADIDEKACASRPTNFAEVDSCHSFQGGQGRGLHGQAVSVADIASAVCNWSDHPLIDKTGIDGLFKIDTEGWVPMRPRMPRPPGQEPTAEDTAMADPGRATLFQIFDRLGLKLEPQKAPVEMFVIESIGRPSQN